MKVLVPRKHLEMAAKAIQMDEITQKSEARRRRRLKSRTSNTKKVARIKSAKTQLEGSKAGKRESSKSRKKTIQGENGQQCQV